MKLIGTSAGGNPIVELEATDRDEILRLGEFLARIPIILVEGKINSLIKTCQPRLEMGGRLAPRRKEKSGSRMRMKGAG